MKDEIEQLLRSTKRKGIEEVIQYLNESGFYTAPASSKFHGAKKGGLVEHVHHTYTTMSDMNVRLNDKQFPRESIILVGLLHDVCKIEAYKPNILKSGDQSEAKPYEMSKHLPLGHGEKSAIILTRLGLELTDEELLGIRWHMNAFDDISHYKCSNAWNKLSILCFIADYFASEFLE